MDQEYTIFNEKRVIWYKIYQKLQLVRKMVYKRSSKGTQNSKKQGAQMDTLNPTVIRLYLSFQARSL